MSLVLLVARSFDLDADGWRLSSQIIEFLAGHSIIGSHFMSLYKLEVSIEQLHFLVTLSPLENPFITQFYLYYN
jgi:hypothetical protein